MEKQRKRMTACLVLAVIIIAIAAMVLIDIAATKITGVQLDVPDTIECSDTYTIVPEFSYAQRAPSEKRLEKELERLGMHYSSDDDMRRASRPPANRGRERKLRKLSNPRASLQPLWVALD